MYSTSAPATSTATITLPININSTGFKLPIIAVDNAADNMLGVSSISNSTLVIKKGVNDNSARTGRWGLISL